MCVCVGGGGGGGGALFMSDLLKWSQSTVADVGGLEGGRRGGYYSNTRREERSRKHADALGETLFRSTGCRSVRLNMVV